MADRNRSVRATIQGASAVAARMPAITGVVALPRLIGWRSRPFAELLTRVRGEIVRAVTANDVRLSQASGMLRNAFDDVATDQKPQVQAELRSQIAKVWCITHRSDPIALQALCECPDAPLDSATASLVIDSSAGFGEMGRSRVLGALAKRALQTQAALAAPDVASRILAAAQLLPWEAPGHEAVARACAMLDSGLQRLGVARRADFETALGTTVKEVVEVYAGHPRTAVVEEVARTTDRVEVLQSISERAEAVYEIDPRMTHRLIAALAANGHTPPALLKPFLHAELWTDRKDEQIALGALLDRAVPTPEPRSRDAVPSP